MPFLDRLSRWAADRPGAPAVVVGTKVLSYAGLAEAAAALGRGSGLTAVCLPNSVEAVAAIAGAMSGSGRCAVLDPAWPSQQRAAVLSRLEPDTVLDGPEAVADTAGSSTGTTLADGPPGSVFLVGLTSGTTALPKAFSRTRRSWQLSLEVTGQLFGLHDGAATLAPGPLSSGVNLYALAECLREGTPFHTVAGGTAEALEALGREDIGRLVVVPAQLRLLAERAGASPEGRAAGRRLSSIVSGGAKLDPATRAAARAWAPEAVIHEYYGASELSFVAASRQAPGEPALPGTAVGRPFPGVSVAVLDDQGQPCGPGRSGNICVDSALISRGYLWGDDRAGLRRFGRWATVQDQGCLDDDGVLHFLGRKADMLVTSGRNVFPQEVEAALAGVAGVRQVIAAGVADGRRGMKVVAAVLADGDLRAQDLRRQAAGALAEAARPRRYYRLRELPLTAAGKLSRALLADWVLGADTRVEPLE
ncbi:AMP-binding protein [Paenarthrobacter sp. DKR-5]|uniref:class I adenylate-forming enzyme family protein n=1 Tax=Paenarthrobacter sp. DKR-5 TaxID=2835535 RepID=UPI001BDBFEBF|nr:AMP-binding protein [Paenarthrobacter sp. DKR-5]MBT1001842.1 AMP-binding protein [Paenarthrobacter sp. DKR-5]